MTDKEFEIYQEEKSIAFLRGLVIGVTSTVILIGIIHLLIYLES